MKVKRDEENQKYSREWGKEAWDLLLNNLDLPTAKKSSRHS